MWHCLPSTSKNLQTNKDIIFCPEDVTHIEACLEWPSAFNGNFTLWLRRARRLWHVKGRGYLRIATVNLYFVLSRTIFHVLLYVVACCTPRNSAAATTFGMVVFVRELAVRHTLSTSPMINWAVAIQLLKPPAALRKNSASTVSFAVREFL